MQLRPGPGPRIARWAAFDALQRSMPPQARNHEPPSSPFHGRVLFKADWLSGRRRWFHTPVRKGAGSNPGPGERGEGKGKEVGMPMRAGAVVGMVMMMAMMVMLLVVAVVTQRTAKRGAW